MDTTANIIIKQLLLLPSKAFCSSVLLLLLLSWFY